MELTEGHPFVAAVARRRETLRELLLIERLEPGRRGAGQIAEVDLHLLWNRIGLEDLVELAAEAGAPLSLEPFVEVCRESGGVPTSATFPLRTMDKVNLYYVVGEARRARR